MKLEQILNKHFGYERFRQGQREIIEDVLAGTHVLAMLPTGGGKSICYQVPGYARDGAVVIVSPLLSLMEDQVQQLKANGEKRVIALNSFLSVNRRNEVLPHLDKYRFIYVSPEILQSDRILEALKRITISLFVVDEAHCISQWGHEFRTDYLKLGDTMKQLDSPTCLALTATAGEEVRRDIEKQLGLHHMKHHIYSIDRPNVAMTVEKLDSHEEKMDRLIDLAKQLKGPGMVYFSSRMLAENAAERLKMAGVERTAFYHGGLANEERILIQQQFLNDQIDLICSTNAFGMGVNKPNIRYIIHFHHPSQVEAYIQEIGRAGRDGDKAVAIMLVAPGDDEVPLSFIDRELPDKRVLSRGFQTLKKVATSSTMWTREKEEQLQAQLDMTETQWRFLKFHLEQKGVWSESGLRKEGLTDELFDKIMEKSAERSAVKYEKLRKMTNWIHTDQCRRLGLTRLFGQRPVLEEGGSCCDVCGIDLQLYRKPFPQSDDTPGAWDWRSELQTIFHQSE